MMYLKKELGPSGTERVSLFIPVEDDGKKVWFQAIRDNGEITMRVRKKVPPADAVKVCDADGSLSKFPEYAQAMVQGMNAQRDFQIYFEALKVHRCEPDVGDEQNLGLN